MTGTFPATVQCPPASGSRTGKDFSQALAATTGVSGTNISQGDASLTSRAVRTDTCPLCVQHIWPPVPLLPQGVRSAPWLPQGVWSESWLPQGVGQQCGLAPALIQAFPTSVAALHLWVLRDEQPL